MPRNVRMQYRKGEVVTALIEEHNQLIQDLADAGLVGLTITAQKIADQNGRDHDGAEVADPA